MESASKRKRLLVELLLYKLSASRIEWFQFGSENLWLQQLKQLSFNVLIVEATVLLSPLRGDATIYRKYRG